MVCCGRDGVLGVREVVPVGVTDHHRIREPVVRPPVRPEVGRKAHFVVLPRLSKRVCRVRVLVCHPESRPFIESVFFEPLPSADDLVGLLRFSEVGEVALGLPNDLVALARKFLALAEREAATVTDVTRDDGKGGPEPVVSEDVSHVRVVRVVGIVESEHDVPLVGTVRHSEVSDSAVDVVPLDDLDVVDGGSVEPRICFAILGREIYSHPRPRRLCGEFVPMTSLVPVPVDEIQLEVGFGGLPLVDALGNREIDSREILRGAERGCLDPRPVVAPASNEASGLGHEAIRLASVCR